MKTTFLIFVGFFISLASYAQDIIILRDGKEIKAIVQEISKADIKYKKLGNPYGPSYAIDKIKVFKIKYKKGTEDFFEDYQEIKLAVSPPVIPTPTPAPAVVTQQVAPTPTLIVQPVNQTPKTSPQELYDTYNHRKTNEKPQKSNENKFKIGIMGGVSLANLRTDASGSTTSSLTTFHAGIVTEVAISDNFMIQPILMYAGQGTALQVTDTYKSGTSSVNIITNGNLSIQYITIPVNALYITSAGNSFLKVGAGPYVGFKIGQSIKNKYTESSSGIEITADKFPSTYAILERDHTDLSAINKTIDLGINLVAQFEMSNGFMIQAGYSIGLTAIDSSTTAAKNSTLNFGIGYFLNK